MDFLLQIAANWVLPAIFFLFVLSFFTMIIVDSLDSIFHWKSRFLRKAVNWILGDELEKEFWNNLLANPLWERVTPPDLEEKTFARIIGHWIAFGVPGRSSREDGPSSAGKKVDIQKNIEKFTKDGLPLGQLLVILAEDANLYNSKDPSQSLGMMEVRIAAWFHDVHGQVGRRYQRFVQKILFGIGLIVACITNFDVIEMVSTLWKMSLMKELVDMSQKAGQQAQIDTSLFTSLPIGWQQSDLNLMTTPTLIILKIAGIVLGGFFISIAAEYIYNFVKRSREKRDSKSI